MTPPDSAPSIRIKLDEALPPSLGEPFTSRSYVCLTVAQQGWSGTEHDALWQLVLREQELFITPDKRFGDVRLFAPGTHPGIVLLRADSPSIPAYRSLCERLLSHCSLEDLGGALTVVTDRNIRIRKS